MIDVAKMRNACVPTHMYHMGRTGAGIVQPPHNDLSMMRTRRSTITVHVTRTALNRSSALAPEREPTRTGGDPRAGEFEVPTAPSLGIEFQFGITNSNDEYAQPYTTI
jgi:hypothetical protein